MKSYDKIKQYKYFKNCEECHYMRVHKANIAECWYEKWKNIDDCISAINGYHKEEMIKKGFCK